MKVYGLGTFCLLAFLSFHRYLQNNQFTGTIDVLANLPLENLWVTSISVKFNRTLYFLSLQLTIFVLMFVRNVANNHFTGWVPEQLININLQ